MINKITIIGLLIGALIGGSVIGIKNNIGKNEVNQGNKNSENLQVNRDNCLSDDCLSVDDLDYPVDELSSEIQDTLYKAIKDEYKAKAVYEATIDKFGSVRPFSMIIRAEEQHISSLEAIYDKYGLTIPEPEKLSIYIPDTLPEVCQIGVNAEIENVNLYKKELLPKVSKYSDITSVFNNLMNASQGKHLPAFQRCAN